MSFSSRFGPKGNRSGLAFPVMYEPSQFRVNVLVSTLPFADPVWSSVSPEEGDFFRVKVWRTRGSRRDMVETWSMRNAPFQAQLFPMSANFARGDVLIVEYDPRLFPPSMFASIIDNRSNDPITMMLTNVRFDAPAATTRMAASLRALPTLSVPLGASQVVDHRCTYGCVPPATFRLSEAQPPFNAPVRFGRKSTSQMWEWIKAGEPSRPCTAAEDAKFERLEQYNPCRAKIGDPLYQTLQFRVVR